MRILIGYDGSEYGKTILADLKNAGLPEEIETLVMTVADVREIPTSPFLAARISSQIERLFSANDEELQRSLKSHLEMAQADALEVVRRLKKQFPEWRLSAESVSDSMFRTKSVGGTPPI